MGLALTLLLFVILAGPTRETLAGFFGNLVAYVEYLPALSNPFGREDANFSQGWTAFYWAWWIAYAPFVGLFVARISRGRTIRQLVWGMLVYGSSGGMLFFMILGILSQPFAGFFDLSVAELALIQPDVIVVA